jgi:hypothetical protein
MANKNRIFDNLSQITERHITSVANARRLQ